MKFNQWTNYSRLQITTFNHRRETTRRAPWKCVARTHMDELWNTRRNIHTTFVERWCPSHTHPSCRTKPISGDACKEISIEKPNPLVGTLTDRDEGEDTYYFSRDEREQSAIWWLAMTDEGCRPRQQANWSEEPFITGSGADRARNKLLLHAQFVKFQLVAHAACDDNRLLRYLKQRIKTNHD